MSFCRITGRSRGLPKPNYFPLLAPISPADAKRCCRITGKSYGLPSHHYIPVLLASSSGKAKCKITNVSGEIGPHHYAPEINYGNRIHTVLPDYRYIFPVLDGSNDAQKALMEMLMTKNVADDKRYVYTVQERRCSLVFSAQMEAAVRDGDVKDVMLAKDSDTVLIKTKQGRNVSMDIKDFTEDVEMFEGEGPNAEVLRQREIEELEEKKRKRKRTAGLSSMKKIFENKEKLADVQEQEEVKHRLEKKSKKAKLEERKIHKQDHVIHHCENYDLQHMRNKSIMTMCSGDWRDLQQPLIESWDWDAFERDMKENPDVVKSKINTLPTPVSLQSQQCDSELYEVDHATSEISAQLESAPCIGKLQPMLSKPKEDVLDAINILTPEQLEDTANVHENLLRDKNEHLLPDVKTVHKVVKNLKKGKSSRLSKVRGLMVDIDKAKTFVPGQYVNTPTGPVFVPGQTVSTPVGPVFLPGMTINTPSGPAILPGHVLSDDKDDQYFAAGQVMRTTNGEQFVQGQTVKNIDNSYHFVEGQTVSTEDGLKFVPGKVINANGTEEFVPGQSIVTPEGVKFVPGQTISETEQEIFIPGQNAVIDGEWQFIPGQTIQIEEKPTFVPGASLSTPNGLKFVPGQTTNVEDQTVFVPGITKKIDDNLRFVPGATVETIDGPKFLEGQIVNVGGVDRFLAGKTLIDSKNHIQFSVAKKPEDIIFHENAPMGLPIDTKTFSISEESLYTFGHMVQTAKGIKFYPGPCPPLVDGKIVPGRVVKNESNESRFVPGMMVEGVFVPGQTVFTENGEQFVPGQVIDTTDGPKFVPGQVVTTKSGPKFVPGQTIQTIDGPRFVPGQIIETKAGPTFIPGQVISTEEEGSRFVPGQVVDTEEGPRFVPGRVIESDDHGVTFVPGQIVQTPEGLKFVAPDLTEGESGLEFSVQSFVVTPEELKLLKIQTNPNDTPSTRGELSIDTKMLRQLSEAGMAIGRQVPAELPAINIVLNDTKHKAMLQSFVADYGLKDGVANQLMAVIASIVEMSVHLKNQINDSPVKNPLISDNKRVRSNKSKYEISENDSGFHDSDDRDHHHENIKNSIAAAVLAAMVTSEQYEDINNNTNKDKYHTILKSINTVLGKSIDEEFVTTMYDILQSEDEKEVLCEQILKHSSHPKRELIRMALDSDLHLSKQPMNEENIIQKFSALLSTENEILGPAFRNIAKSNTKMLKHVLSHISESVSFIANDDQATETLRKAIVAAVYDTSNEQLNDILCADSTELKTLIEQSAGLAKILGMHEVASKLNSSLRDSNSIAEISSYEIGMNILRRTMVMRQLADQNPSMQGAIQKLGKDLELARTDPRLRDLVRESAALMIVPEEPPLLTSQDVPINLLHNENSLAIEDFLLQRRKHPGTLLIMKKGLQCVVPREASRAVLTGQVAYTVLDESGIRHFEPLHVFSALQLNQPTAHRFSMYSCPVIEDEDIDLNAYTGYNANIIRDQRITRYGGWSRYSRGVFLDRENSASRMSSLDYTPSYKRYSSRSRSSSSKSPSKVDDVVVASADYTAVTDDEVSLRAGDIVEVLDTKSSTSAKYRGRAYCYDSHFFQSRGHSLEYIFSAPTYRMYYV